MTDPLDRGTGGQILVDQLKIHGVDLAFCVPGESYLAVLDALYDARNQIRFIICRQEGGAATWPRPMASSPAARHLLRHPRAGRHQCLASACTPPSRIRRR